MQTEFGDELIHFENHVGDDIFETPETQARGSWYGVSGIPHVRIDGKYSQVGAGSCASAASSYRTKINQRRNETGNLSPVAIEGYYIPGTGEITMGATFTLVDPVALTNLRATLLLYEDNITWCCGYGGEDHWEHVTRIIHDQNITLTNVGDAVTVTTTENLNPAWNQAEFHVVAYLQQTSADKPIIQGAMLPLLQDFSFVFDKPVRSIPEGNGTAVFDAVLTNIGDASDTFTLQPGTPLGSWTTDFQVCGDPTYYTTPVQIALDPNESCNVRVRVHTGAEHEKRNGGFQITSAATARVQDTLMRVFNGSYSVMVVDDDNNHTDETTLTTPLTNLNYLYDLWQVTQLGMSPIFKDMNGFDIVIWDHSWWGQSDALTAANQADLMQFMDGGGSLFLTSQQIANQITPNTFTQNYLGVASWELDKGYDHLYGVAGDVIGDGLDLPLSFNYPSFKKGDHLLPGPNAAVSITSNGGWNTTLRNAMPSGAKSVFMASAWVAISQTDPDPNNARVTLQRILDWLAPETPAGVEDGVGAGVANLVTANPNPFGMATEISFALTGAAAAEKVRMEVYDLAGRRVASLFEGTLPTGEHRMVWNGRNEGGSAVESGIYFARLTTNEGVRSEKLVLLK